MTVEKISKLRQTFGKNNVFQLSHGLKNINRSKLHLEHTHRRKRFLQLLLFKDVQNFLVLLTVCESFRFRQMRCTLVCTSLLCFYRGETTK